MSQDATTDTTTTDATADATTEPTLVATEPTLDVADDRAASELSKVRQEAADKRIKLREANEALEAAQTERDQFRGVVEGLQRLLNPEAPAEVDPAAQVTELTATNESLATKVNDLSQEILVRDLADDANANAKALMDSMSFRDTLRAFDATADDYSAKVADAIKAAVENNSSLRAVQGTSRGGAENAGGASTDGAVTQAQFDAMGIAERTALYNSNLALYRRLAGSA